MIIDLTHALLDFHAPGITRWANALDDNSKRSKRGARREFRGRVVWRSPLGGMAKSDRNQPCPCASGVKFKKCCHGLTWQEVGGKYARRMLSIGSHDENVVWARLVLNGQTFWKHQTHFFTLGVQEVAKEFLSNGNRN